MSQGSRRGARSGRPSKPKVTRAEKLGLPAGTPVYVGALDGETPTRIMVLEYDGEHFAEREVADIRTLLPLKPPPTVTWINVDGVHDAGVLNTFGEAFNLHPLLLEDILNTDQRPKVEITEDLIYIILKMFDFDGDRQELRTEQVSLVLGKRFVITFEEDVGDEFDVLRTRLRGNSSRIRKEGADYLAYALLDVVVDRYFLVSEKIGECLEEIENALTFEPDSEVLPRVHHLRRELIFLRKHIWPVREVVSSLQRGDSDLIAPHTLTYLRDVYDHTIQIIDTVETHRDLVSGIQDLYLSVMSNRMNEIMKVLTVISTIFIPLTFIVGVYGMNFHYMPELGWRLGYPTVWLVMALIATGMILYFKRKRWF